MMKTRMLLSLVFFWNLNAHAQHDIGNGGDLVRMGFIKEGKQILNRISKTPDAILLLDKNKITVAALREKLSIKTIGVTQDVLEDNGSSVVDSLFKDEHIWLSKPIWLEYMGENADADQLILHELLRAVHFNDDDYVLSSEIMPLLPPQEKKSETILSKASKEREIEQQQQETPPEGANPFSYHAASQAYALGKAPHLNGLKGIWNLQGMAGLPFVLDPTLINLPAAESDQTTTGYYNARYLEMKGKEGKIFRPHQLSFSPQSNFDGSKNSSVTFSNLGEDLTDIHQGPNAMSINGLGAVFSQWGYNTGFTADSEACVDTNIYFHFACRTVLRSKDQMVCAIKLKIIHPELTDEDTRPFNGRVVNYLLYRKEK